MPGGWPCIVVLPWLLAPPPLADDDDASRPAAIFVVVIASSSSSSHNLMRPRGSLSVACCSLPAGGCDSRNADIRLLEDLVRCRPPPLPSVEALQRLIALQRTVSNFAVSTPLLALPDGECLRGVISRGVACATMLLAPNHKVAELATFCRILARRPASERLLDC